MTTTSELCRTGGGRFDPTAPSLYFIAALPEHVYDGSAADVNDHLLLAANHLHGYAALSALERCLAQSRTCVLLDSGVFTFATAYARSRRISMDEALSVAPEEMDGFEALFAHYVTLVRQFGDRLWGYIEIDQGGREAKKRTRARLEALGLAPIPVYHPLNDGWDYFDELACRYDRICFGNVVNTKRSKRLQLLATAWERARRYPHLWVHVLGLTPSPWLNAYPMHSTDSSSWLAPVRWHEATAVCDFAPVGALEPGLLHRHASVGGHATESDGQYRAARLAAYSAHMHTQTWQVHLRELFELGAVRFPDEQTEVRRVR